MRTEDGSLIRPFCLRARARRRVSRIRGSETASVARRAGRGSLAVIAEALQGAQRDQAWRLFTEASDAFLGYQKRTDRVIPVFVLRIREP
ncbi:nitroreductase/quinone reductase family protein [Microbacterium sp. ZXX196]|uniref:nitroreductase/quinone reductase family protein n=1 Tax=Microbacterium sp. ZXX196 TaxID=2609291 RepID=UPI001E5BC3DB|nr:nitroreductase/quinone reductase family protein [Microbacterium sp. ZXX196]